MTTITYLPDAQEEDDGIGPWTVNVTDANSEPPFTPGAGLGLAEFEQDRVARLNAHYADALRTHGNSGSALVNGSVGASCIACRQSVPGYVVNYG